MSSFLDSIGLLELIWIELIQIDLVFYITIFLFYSFNLLRRNHAKAEVIKIKIVMETMMGYILIPHGEKLRLRPMRVTTAKLNAMLRVVRSTKLRLFILGRIKAIVVYPGKKKINGTLRIARKIFEEKKVTMRMKRIDKIFINIRSLLNIILITQPSLWNPMLL